MKDLIWRLLGRLGLRPGDYRIFALDEEMTGYVYVLAERDQRPVDEVVSDLLNRGLAQRDLADDLWQAWLRLSPREQQVASLACLSYTNNEIAQRLLISPETVKAHIRHILHKFDLHCREELRLLLSDWNFSAWEK